MVLRNHDALRAAGPCKVLDIGGGQITDTLKAMMEKTFLNLEAGRQRPLLPPALLSDEAGLRIWHDITRLPDYYQTREEIDLLEAHGKDLASHIVEGCTLVDLGCGDIRKIKPLLDALDACQKSVQYLALDLSKPVLEECLERLSPNYQYVQCCGLWGTFADALRWAAKFSGPKFFLSLGSIYGNDRFDSAVTEFRKWSHTLQQEDRLLIGVDAKDDPQQVWNSYHDSHGIFDKFMRNALHHSNKVLGQVWYRPEDWEIVGKMEPEYPIHHRFIFRALTDVKCDEYGLEFKPRDEIDCYEVFKNGPDVLKKAFHQAGLRQVSSWTAPSGSFHEYLLVPSHFRI